MLFSALNSATALQGPAGLGASPKARFADSVEISGPNQNDSLASFAPRLEIFCQMSLAENLHPKAEASSSNREDSPLGHDRRLEGPHPAEAVGRLLSLQDGGTSPQD